MKQPIVVMNFTHVYESEKFYKSESCQWIDCTDILGTNGYCDKIAEKQIRERIKKISPEGIHFIDSGNFHYVSRFWIDKIEKPFVLVLFDHHTDMQPSRFGDFMSCGSWVKEILDTNTYIKKVILIGADERYLKQLDPAYKDRLYCITTKEIRQQKTRQQLYEIWKDTQWYQLPVYISIDKDVLSKKEEITNWDQGNMSLELLERVLSGLLTDHSLIGIDICGECADFLQQGLDSLISNDKNNWFLLSFFTEYSYTKST